MIWGLSLHGWEDIMRASLALAGVFGLIVGLSTWFVVRLQREEIAASKEEFEQYKLDAGTKIAEVSAAGETAKAEAAKANAAAESERLERLKLEAAVAPRRLSNEQGGRLVSTLSRFADRTVRIKSYALDAESAMLGQQIIDVLKAAHIRVDDNRMSQSALGSLALGVRITGQDRELVNAMLNAFPRIGNLVVSPEAPPPTTGVSIGPQDDQDMAAVIFVGIKPFQ